MPQLDRLLSAMVSNRAEALRLVENELASLVKDGATVPVTKQVLGASQLLGLLREIAPPDALRQLDEGTSTEFQYRTGDGVFNAKASNEGGKWMAAITSGTNGANGASSAPAPAAGRPTPSMAAARVPSVTSVTVQVGEDANARAAIANVLPQLI